MSNEPPRGKPRGIKQQYRQIRRKRRGIRPREAIKSDKEAPQPKKLHPLIKGVWMILAVIILLPPLIITLLNTDQGRDFLVQTTKQQMSALGIETTIEDLHGTLPFSLALGRLSLADSKGEWLEVVDFKFEWLPQGPPLGSIYLQELSAAEITLHRPPTLPDSQAPLEPEKEMAPASANPLAGIPGIRLDLLEVKRLTLGEAILGTPAIFSLEGNGGVDEAGKKVTVKLDIKRLDQATARIQADVTYDFLQSELDLNLSAQETGGMISMLSGMQEAGDLSFSLKGRGAISHWPGQLYSRLEGVGNIDSSLILAINNDVALSLDGTVKTHQDLLGFGPEPWGFTTHILRHKNGDINLEKLTFDLPPAKLETTVSLAHDTQQLNSDTIIRIADLNRLNHLTGTPLSGAMEIQVSAEGKLPKPKIHVKINGTTITVPQLSMAAVNSSFSAHWPDSNTGEPSTTLTFSGTGSFIGIEPTEGVPLPEKEIHFDLAGSRAESGIIDLDQFSITGKTFTLGLTGEANPSNSVVAARFHGALKKPGPWSKPFGTPIDGRLDINADISVKGKTPRISIGLNSRFSDFKGIEAAEVLLGEKLDLVSMITVDESQRVTITDLSLKGRAFSLTGPTLTVDSQAQTVSGSLNLDLPDLSPLSNMVGKRLSGQVNTTATISGSFNAPALQLDLNGDSIRLDQEQLKKITLALNTAGPIESTGGNINVSLLQNNHNVSLTTPFKRTHNGINLQNIKLVFPGGMIRGPLSLDSSGPLITATMTGKVDDLTALMPPPKMALIGNADFIVKLKPEEKKQAMTLDLNLTTLRGEFGSIKEASLAAKINDLMADMDFETVVKLNQFKSSNGTVEAIILKSQGTREEIFLTADARGKQLYPFDIQTKAQVKQSSGGRVDLFLNSLEGTVGQDPIQLKQPTQVTLVDESVNITPLELVLGEARLHSKGGINPKQVEGEIKLEMPLKSTETFGAPALKGFATIHALLSGHPNKPKSDIQLHVKQFGLQDPAFEHIPPADMRAHISLNNGWLEVESHIEKLTEKPAVAQAKLPVSIKLMPFSLEVPTSAPLDGRFDIQARMANLIPLLGPDGWNLVGLLNTSLVFGGTVQKPDVNGDITFANGIFESQESGTTMDNITVAAKLKDKSLQLTTLSATDGMKGKLSGTGLVKQSEDGEISFDFTGILDKARLVNREDMNATISGKIEVHGNSKKTDITGTLTTDQAIIYLPEGGGTDIETITVVDNNSADKRLDQPPASPINLDMVLNFPGKIFVRGRGLDSEWRGKLDLTGPVSNPIVLGNLAVKRGYFDFLDHRFLLKKGIVDFNGAAPPDPSITISGTISKQDLLARITLEGQSDNIKLALTSQPEQPQDEILSKLLFDRDSSVISPTQAIKLAAAVAKLQGGGGPGAMSKIQSAMGIDTLDVGGDSMETGTVKAGKYIGEKTFLSIERGLGEGSGKVGIEYEFSPEITFETEIDQQKNGAFGANWKFDY